MLVRFTSPVRIAALTAVALLPLVPATVTGPQRAVATETDTSSPGRVNTTEGTVAPAPAGSTISASACAG